MTDLDALIARVEAATEGSRELDAQIAKTLSLRGAPSYSPHLSSDIIPNYTTSIDAALLLVPPLCSYTIELGIAWVRWLTADDVAEVDARATTTALAITAAALKARREA